MPSKIKLVPTSISRSANMRAVKSKNTGPELIVRRLLHKMGHRFRLHKKELPGRPDLHLQRHNLAIFVHGCFWHRHQACKYATIPNSNVEFWHQKFAANKVRDKRNEDALHQLGIRVLVLWECEVDKGEEFLKSQLFSILSKN